jgi:hypothetical protein
MVSLFVIIGILAQLFAYIAARGFLRVYQIDPSELDINPLNASLRLTATTVAAAFGIGAVLYVLFLLVVLPLLPRLLGFRSKNEKDKQVSSVRPSRPAGAPGKPPQARLPALLGLMTLLVVLGAIGAEIVYFAAVAAGKESMHQRNYRLVELIQIDTVRPPSSECDA